MQWERYIGTEIPAKAFIVLGWHDSQLWHRCAWEDNSATPLRFGVIIGHDFEARGMVTFHTPGAKVLCCETKTEALDMASLVKGTPVMGWFWPGGLPA